MKLSRLTSTLATAFILPGFLAGCAAETKCGFGGCTGDAQITGKVESLLNDHSDIGTEVNVQTLNHVVYLSGFVAAGEMRTTAGDLAGSVPGVTKVVNTIAVTH